MALKLIAVVASDPGTESARAKIYRDSEWQEYRVRYFLGDHYLGESCDSYHDDKEDAFGTAKQELIRMPNPSERRKSFNHGA